MSFDYGWDIFIEFFGFFRLEFVIKESLENLLGVVFNGWLYIGFLWVWGVILECILFVCSVFFFSEGYENIWGVVFSDLCRILLGLGIFFLVFIGFLLLEWDLGMF